MKKLIVAVGVCLMLWTASAHAQVTQDESLEGLLPRTYELMGLLDEMEACEARARADRDLLTYQEWAAKHGTWKQGQAACETPVKERLKPYDE